MEEFPYSASSLRPVQLQSATLTDLDSPDRMKRVGIAGVRSGKRPCMFVCCGHMFQIKICGITNVDDALAAVDAGADAVGLNFYPKSSRFIDRTKARAIVDAVGD